MNECRGNKQTKVQVRELQRTAGGTPDYLLNGMRLLEPHSLALWVQSTA